MEKPEEITICRDCYEISVGYVVIANGQRRCMSCGGVCLTVQEAADHIAEQHSELRTMRELYE